MQFVSFLQDDSTCTKTLINAQVDQCTYVKTACADQTDYLNFITFYYCDIDQNVPLIILVCALFVVVAFQFLGTTADNFLSESLEVVAAKLKISDAIAAVTFLALANGAADCITGIVAGGKGASGVYIAMGGLFGAALFTVTVVFARCIQGDAEAKSKHKDAQPNEGISVDPKVFVRDVSFILSAALYFYIVASFTAFTIPLVCFYFVIYILYFVVVIYQISRDNKGKKKENEKKTYGTLNNEPERQPIIAVEPVHSHHDLDILQINDPEAKSAIQKIKDAIDQKLQEENPEGYKLKKSQQKPTLAHALWQYVYLNTYYSQKLQAKRAIRRARAHKASLEEEKLGEEGKVAPSEPSEEEYADNLWGKFMFRYDQVTLFIRQLTIPQFDDTSYNFWLSLAPPIFGVLFLSWTFGVIPPTKTWVWWVILGICAALELLHVILFFLNVNLAKKVGAIQGLLAFIVSAMWIDLVASSLMDMLALITVISGLPLTYLSLTMLAWGNSMDDYFIDYVFSKKGKGPMAVTGVFAGQFFNLLLGFGGGLFRLCLSGPLSFDFYTGGTDNALNIFLLVGLIFALVAILAVAWFTGFKIGKRMMYFLMSYYVIFIIAATIIIAV